MAEITQIAIRMHKALDLPIEKLKAAVQVLNSFTPDGDNVDLRITVGTNKIVGLDPHYADRLLTSAFEVAQLDVIDKLHEAAAAIQTFLESDWRVYNKLCAEQEMKPAVEPAQSEKADECSASGCEEASPVPARLDHGNVGIAPDFIVAAISPDERLYELANISRVRGERGNRGYAVYEVDSDARKHRCNGEGYPAPMSSRAEATAAFREWAKGKGYEVHPREIYERHTRESASA